MQVGEGVWEVRQKQREDGGRGQGVKVSNHPSAVTPKLSALRVFFRGPVRHTSHSQGPRHPLSCILARLVSGFLHTECETMV